MATEEPIQSTESRWILNKDKVTKDKVTIEEILADKPNMKILLAKILIQTTLTNNNVADNHKAIKLLESEHEIIHDKMNEKVEKIKDDTLTKSSMKWWLLISGILLTIMISLGTVANIRWGG